MFQPIASRYDFEVDPRDTFNTLPQTLILHYTKKVDFLMGACSRGCFFEGVGLIDYFRYLSLDATS